MKNIKNVNMKKLFRRNQIIITTLAIMIAAAGYLNYAGKQEASNNTEIYEAGMTGVSDADILKENQNLLYDAQTKDMKEIASLDDPSEGLEEAAATEETAAGAPAGGEATAQTQVAEGDLQAGLENPGEAVLTSGMNVSDYIANVQLSREQVRAKNKETLMALINSTTIEEAAKQDAIQNMINMTAVAEKENAAETLLMAKGFSDPVVSITDGKVDVVINAAAISDPQRAQIEDIVKRKTEVGAENIIITLLNLAE